MNLWTTSQPYSEAQEISTYPGDFNIPWNITEHPDTTSMQEIMDMHDLKQHIHIQMHKLGNTLDWFISNSPNNIIDITNKDYLSDRCIIEWKFQVSLKVREKTQTSRRDLSKIDEEKFNHDLNMNLEIDTRKHFNRFTTNIWMP